MTEEQQLALGIDADLGALRKRIVLVQEALKWAKQGRHVHEYIGVLADEVERLRLLLPFKTPVLRPSTHEADVSIKEDSVDT
jgi:hypothetical protein